MLYFVLYIGLTTGPHPNVIHHVVQFILHAKHHELHVHCSLVQEQSVQTTDIGFELQDGSVGVIDQLACQSNNCEEISGPGVSNVTRKTRRERQAYYNVYSGNLE